MARTEYASTSSTSSATFGAWLRARRETAGKVLRVVAAAAEMDPSHLGKAERDERLPTTAQVLAIAKFLGLDAQEARARLAAARLWRECDGDAATAVQAAQIVQEPSGVYSVNKPANKK